jgi:hypothetical protein
LRRGSDIQEQEFIDFKLVENAHRVAGIPYISELAEADGLDETFVTQQ